MKLNIKIDDQTFVVEIEDLDQRPVHARVDGEAFEVWPEEPALAAARPFVAAPAGVTPPPRPVVQAGALPAAAAAAVSNAVTAPIPGVILSIAVKPGDTVVFGQELCVLEAMKMKNQIRANRAGVVASVCVAAGDSVKHGQVLLEYRD